MPSIFFFHDKIISEIQGWKTKFPIEGDGGSFIVLSWRGYVYGAIKRSPVHSRHRRADRSDVMERQVSVT